MTIIPIVSGVPSQTLKVDLMGNTYNFRIIYNTRSGVWTFDLTNEDGDALCSGVTMVLGADLINQYNLGIGRLILARSGTGTADPASEELGDTVKLLHLEPGEIVSASTI